MEQHNGLLETAVKPTVNFVLLCLRLLSFKTRGTIVNAYVKNCLFYLFIYKIMEDGVLFLFYLSCSQKY